MKTTFDGAVGGLFDLGLPGKLLKCKTLSSIAVSTSLKSYPRLVTNTSFVVVVFLLFPLTV